MSVQQRKHRRTVTTERLKNRLKAKIKTLSASFKVKNPEILLEYAHGHVNKDKKAALQTGLKNALKICDQIAGLYSKHVIKCVPLLSERKARYYDAEEKALKEMTIPCIKTGKKLDWSAYKKDLSKLETADGTVLKLEMAA